MVYSDFTLDNLKTRFGLEFGVTDVFSAAPPAAPGAVFRAVLEENLPLARTMRTEKARSELLVSPVLVEVRRQFNRRVSLFSGVEFNVDPVRGLVGVCDFLLDLSTGQWLVGAPVVTVVEAKKDDTGDGIPRCAAEMFAARMFNERGNRPLSAVYGVVTTGTLWRFLRLEGHTLAIGSREFPIEQVDSILGIFLHLLREVSEHGPTELTPV